MQERRLINFHLVSQKIINDQLVTQMENLGAVQYIQEGFALMSHLNAKLPSKVQYQCRVDIQMVGDLKSCQ